MRSIVRTSARLVCALTLALAAPALAAQEAAKAPAPAADEARQLVEKVQRYYEKTADFSADVEQVYVYRAMGRTQKASGRMQIKRPGMMRWDVVKPYPKQFVLDGKALYAYDADDQQVMVKRDFTGDALPAAVTFLWGRGKLTDEFHVQKVDRPDYGPVVLELTPKKPQPGIQRLFFAVDAATGAVNVSVVIDSQDNENRIAFSGVKTNQGLGDAAFRFHIPKGAAVVEQ